MRKLASFKKLCLIGMFSSLPALAATQSTSQADLSVGQSLLQKARPDAITYWSEYAGPALGRGGERASAEGEDALNSMELWNQISVRWKISDKYTFVANPRFIWNLDRASGADEYVFDDPVVGVIGEWYRNGRFSFGGAIDSITPLARTNGTIEDGLLFNPGGFNSVNYILDENWSVGSWIFGRYNIYRDAIAETQEQFAFWVAPAIHYTATDNLNFRLFYRLNYTADNESRLKLDEDESLNLMVGITLNQYLTLEPIISMYRASDYSIENANFGMWLSGRLF